MHVEPYLFFEGRCEEALEFYRAALGAEFGMLMRFKDSPDPTHCAPGGENKIMHAQIKIGTTTILASDGRNQGKPNFQGFALSITAGSDAEAEKWFQALCDGESGQILMPMTKTFYASRFGMVTDKFGVMWMVISGK